MTFPARIVLSGLLVLGVAASSLAFEPTTKYKSQKIHGFTILVSPEANEHPRETGVALAMIETQLKRAADTIPEKPLKVLRGVKIWVEWDVPQPNPKAVVLARYFPGDGFLKANNMNPDKADTVELLSVRKFTAATGDGVTDVIVHELAHGYHKLALEKMDGKIDATYKQAVDRKLYDNVEHRNGVRTKAYAISSKFEYFAVLSEAYFGRSYNFPYDREGLGRYDPAGHALMVEMWGKPR